MLEVKNVVKKFGDFTAVSGISLTIPDGSVVGLIGSNGAGKSTIIRMLTGVYKPNEGEVLYDGKPVYDRVDTKREIFYFPDELYFPGSLISDVPKFYRHFFPRFDAILFYELCDAFNLKKRMPIISLSKGMKRQVMMNASIASGAKYIYLDEAFDGLDAVARQTYIKLLIALAREKNSTVIVATHNIREIDGFCDEICLMYKSSIIAKTAPDDLVVKYSRAQFELPEGKDLSGIDEKEIINFREKNGLYTVTFADKKARAKELLASIGVTGAEFIPLTLEDAFVCELEVSGYAIKQIQIS